MKEVYKIKLLMKQHGSGVQGLLAKDMGMTTSNFYQRLMPEKNCGYKFRERLTIAYNMRFQDNRKALDLFELVPEDYEV